MEGMVDERPADHYVEGESESSARVSKQMILVERVDPRGVDSVQEERRAAL